MSRAATLVAMLAIVCCGGAASLAPGGDAGAGGGGASTEAGAPDEASVGVRSDDAGGKTGFSEAGSEGVGATASCPPSMASCNGACVGASAGSAPCSLSWSYVTTASAVAFAVDAHNVYWTQNTYPGGSVMMVSKSGGMPTTLRSTMTGTPVAIAADSTSVYWGEYDGPDAGSIDSLPSSALGSTPHALTTMGGATVIAVSGSTLCFADTMDVGCMPTAGGPVTILNPVQGGPVLDMAVDSTTAYWTTWSTNGAVFSAPIVGGSVNLLVPHTDRPAGIAVDDKNVYWVGNGTGTVNAMPIGGGAVTTLATGPGYAGSLALDSGYLFWGAGLDTNDSAILKMPVTGGTPTILAWGVYGADSLVVDSQFVYFMLQNGSIAKAPR